MKLQKTISIVTSFIICIIIADVATGYIGKYLTEKVAGYGGNINKIDYTTNHLETDILIVGSSRAQHHYVCSILQASINNFLGTDYTIYNAGLNGHYIDCSCCWIECVISRKHPKVIILDVDEYEFYENKKQIEENELFIYYNYNPIIKTYFDENYSEWKNQIKLHSNLYRFNEELVRLCVLLAKGDAFLSTVEDGYAPLYNIMSEPTAPSKKQKPEGAKKSEMKVNRKKINKFKNIIQLCQKEHIQLIVSSSPWYKKNTHSKLIADICTEYNIPYLDMDNNKTLQENHLLYQDQSHLNDTGAQLFTKELFNELKKFL